MHNYHKFCLLGLAIIERERELRTVCVKQALDYIARLPDCEGTVSR